VDKKLLRLCECRSVSREGQEEKAKIGLARRRMDRRRLAAQDYILD